MLREIGSVRYAKKPEGLEKSGGGKNGMIVKNRWSDCGCESCVSWMSISDKRLHVVVQEPSQGINRAHPIRRFFLFLFFSFFGVTDEHFYN